MAICRWLSVCYGGGAWGLCSKNLCNLLVVWFPPHLSCWKILSLTRPVCPPWGKRGVNPAQCLDSWCRAFSLFISCPNTCVACALTCASSGLLPPADVVGLSYFFMERGVTDRVGKTEMKGGSLMASKTLP